MLEKLIKELLHIIEKAKFADTCCDHSEDRMYHAKDNSWWKRVGNHWKAAAPPRGWVKE